jgi:precorrin-6A/cobalt-precorrin-6A reductase
MPQLARFCRPLFALGREPLGHLNDIPSHQHWFIRCLNSDAFHPQATIISARGPFYLEEEYTLLRHQQIDVIVCKNSGSAATEAKLSAARALKMPVLMRKRPELPAGDRTFSSIEALSEALTKW